MPFKYAPLSLVQFIVALAWTAAGGEDSFWLSVGTEPGGSSIFDANLNSVATTYSLLLTAGGYYWRVYGMASGVKGDPSEEGFVIVP